MKNKILALSFALLAFSSSQALAVTFDGEEPVVVDGQVDAYADLDWKNLIVTGANAFIFSHSQSMARTADYWNITLQPTWVQQTTYNPPILPAPAPAAPNSVAQSIVLSDGNEAAKATGETEATSIVSRSTVQLLSGSYGAYSAEARAMQGQTYFLASGATATFIIPYELFVNVSDNNRDNAEDSYTRAWSWLRLWTGGSDWSQIADTYSAATSGDGSLSIRYTAVADSYLLFEAGADTRVALLNPVPVPPSVLMLLTGCTSLFFLKRRKG
ncbi:MAG: PEP-CTERM sorting domain-containing protein [Desulfobulbaceae bacterium]|nr:PEP-CTERM sorting domain-containing protein [Desulfobulbaceae bacterium]